MNTSQHTSRTLRWHPVRWRHYELVGNGQVFARLRQLGFGNSEMLGEAGERLWKIKRSGWFQSRVKVSDANTGADLGVLAPASKEQQTLLLKDGRSYLWRRLEGCHIEEWAFFASSGAPLLIFQPEEDALYYESVLHIPGEAPLEEELLLLALIGWHLLVSAREDEMTTIAALSAAASAAASM